MIVIIREADDRVAACVEDLFFQVFQGFIPQRRIYLGNAVFGVQRVLAGSGVKIRQAAVDFRSAVCGKVSAVF